MGLILQLVPPIVAHPLTRPDDLGVTHGASRQTDPRKPHHHCRFSRRSDLLSAAWRWQGVYRMRPRLSPGPGLSTGTQGDLSWRWVPDASLPLRPCPPGGAYHLAHPMHHVPRGVHGAPPLRLALPPDAPCGGLVMRCWPPTVALVWSCVQCSI